MSHRPIPPKFEDFSTQQTKNITIVLKIEGVGDVITSRPIYTRIRYGDPGLKYGQPGVVYGGLRPWRDADGNTFRTMIDINRSNLVISQKIEPERGSGSIANLSVTLVDNLQTDFLLQLCTPGMVVNDLLGRACSVFMGYEEISYPEDYLEVFRGYITSLEDNFGSLVLQLSDPNVKRRKEIFFTGKTKLTDAINGSQTTIPVEDSSQFYSNIIGPNGWFDENVLTLIKIDDEWIHAQPHSSNPNLFLVFARGANGSAPAAHSSGAEVRSALKLSGEAIELALKIMLSGWNGPFETDVPILSIGPFPDPESHINTTRRIVFPPGVNVREKFGLVEGDYLFLTGIEVEGGANNFTETRIVRFEELDGTPNRVCVISQDFFKEAPSNAAAHFRSQYDTLPPSAGLRLKPKDVDVERHLYIRDSFFAVNTANVEFFITKGESSGKDFIESQLYRPFSLYSMTRRGQLSVGITKPPIADEILRILDGDNLLDPRGIRVLRATSGRAFYNQVDYYLDYNEEGEPLRIIRAQDVPSREEIGIDSLLRIEARGLKAVLGAEDVLRKLARFTLLRYARGAVQFRADTTWEFGALVGVGDVIGIRDEGELKIANFSTGERDLGFRLYEIMGHELDLKNGKATLLVSGNLGVGVTDRFATISPSSEIASGSTASEIIIRDSFGPIYPGDEPRKWEHLRGSALQVHSYDYSFREVTRLVRFDAANKYKMIVDPPLSQAPEEGWVVDVAKYPDTTDPKDERTLKTLFAFHTPSVEITAGVDTYSFEVDAGDVGKFLVGMVVIIHNEDYSEESPELRVTDISGTTVTVSGHPGFDPDIGHTVECMGFPDGGQAYRWV